MPIRLAIQTGIGLFAVGWLLFAPPGGTGTPGFAGATAAPPLPAPAPSTPSASPESRGAPPGRPAVIARLDEILRAADADAATGDFFALLAEASPDDFPVLFDRLERELGSARQATWVNILIERWARVDPAGALAHLAEPYHWERREQIKRVVEIGLQQDPQAIMAAALGKRHAHTQTILEAFVASGAARDPEATLAWVLDLPRGTIPNEHAILMPLFGAWAKSDPAAAASRTGGIPHLGKRWNARQAVAEVWARSDGAAAVAWLEGFPPGIDRSVALRYALRTWAKGDPAAAAEHALHLTSTYDRASVTKAVAGALYRAEGADALVAWIAQRRPGPAEDDALLAVAKSASRNDPAGALGILDALPDSSGKWEAAEAIAGRIAAVDLGVAVDWINATDGPLRDRLAAGTFGAWAKEDPARAAAHLEQLDGAARARAARAVAAEWAHTAPEEAMAWAVGIGDERTRDTFIKGAFRSLVAADRDAARAHLVGMGPGILRDQMAEVFVRETFRSDAAGSARLADSLYGGPGQVPDHLSSMVGPALARENPASAAEWINRLPQGLGRDNSAAALSRAVVQTDPATAFAWAETVAAPKKRETLVEAALRSLAQQDPAAALQALGNSSLPEERKADLRRTLSAERP